MWRKQMPKYLLQWIEEHWYQHMVEAPSEEAARQMILEDAFRWPEAYAYEIQDYIDVEQVND